jgi:hypothetical protein
MNNDIKNIISLEKLQASGIKIRLMTEEENVQMAELAKKSFYRPKYLSGLKFLTQYDVREYHETHPEAPAKDVLSEMMKTYNPDLPSDILLDMAKVILEEWESLKTSTKELALA